MRTEVFLFALCVDKDPDQEDRSTRLVLLTDYGTHFMAQYFGLRPIDEKSALEDLDSAITYLNSSYGYDSADLNTTFKLSVCYWIQGDCDKAWRFYDECTALGGNPITDDFTNDLKAKCARP